MEIELDEKGLFQMLRELKQLSEDYLTMSRKQILWLHSLSRIQKTLAVVKEVLLDRLAELINRILKQQYHCCHSNVSDGIKPTVSRTDKYSQQLEALIIQHRRNQSRINHS